MVDATENRTRQSQQIGRVTVVGLVVNLLLSVFKVVAGWHGHSQAVLADGIHSLSDLTTDVAVLVGVRFWNAPADDCHPHGHARIEAMVTVFIGLVLAGVGIGLCLQAVRSLGRPQPALPGMLAVGAALVSIVCKELLYRYTIHRGRHLRSQAVIANAWHHRTDAISSIPAAAAVAAARFGPGWQILDPIGAIIVSGFILQAAWKILRPSLHELTDGAAPAGVVEEIRTIALQTTGVQDVHKVRTRQMGAGFQVDLHVLVQDDLTVRQGHDIAGTVRRRLREDGPDLTDVVVHIEPFREHGDG